MTYMRLNLLRLRISLQKSRNSSIQEIPCTQLFRHRLMWLTLVLQTPILLKVQWNRLVSMK